jgi:hypothetical protein
MQRLDGEGEAVDALLLRTHRLQRQRRVVGGEADVGVGGHRDDAAAHTARATCTKTVVTDDSTSVAESTVA